MPTSSSDASAGKSRRTTRRPSTRKTTTRKRATKEEAPADSDEAVVAENDGGSDDFGEGVEEQAPKKARAPRRRKAAASAPEPESKSESVPEMYDPDGDGFAAAASFGLDDDADDDRGDDDRGPGGAEASEDGGEGDDQKPRRRRRRRRRGGSTAQTSNSGGGRGPQGQGDGGRNDGQRGRGRRGRRGRSGTGGNTGNQRGGGGGGGRGGNATRRSRTIQASTEVIEGTFDGVLELHPKGYGFLRDPTKNYAAEDSNPFVSSSVVEKYRLREGVLIRGEVGQGSRGQGPRLKEVELIDGFTPEEYAEVKVFDTLTPINPHEQIRLEVGPRPITMRVMDLLCPIGKGQRALLVAPPRTGKTMLLQDIANSVSENHPEIHLMVLLIDERPEEVTEMRRMVNGEVISSSLDSDLESHIRISQLIIERGKRLAEEGKDVFILLDSITRLARAFNKASNTGRTATGGLDIRALDIPKKLFGTARRFDEGGSLTVCGTALIDTGSRMDEAIFQEFKGTGNMEMVLSRELADRRIWPSIDIGKSGTRREEKILEPDVLEGATMLRRSLISLNPVEAMEQLTRTMEKFPTNKEFLTKIRAVL